MKPTIIARDGGGSFDFGGVGVIWKIDPPIKSAILAIDPTLVDYGTLHTLVTRGSSINVAVQAIQSATQQ